MGTFGGPDIIQEGLFFAIDAGSTRSYPNPGTGTSVNSLVNSTTATLTNGVGFSSANGGQWDFDGTDDYVDLPIAAIPTGNEITISFWNFGDVRNNSSIIAGSKDGSEQTLNIHLPWGDGNIYWDCGSPFDRIYKASTSAETLGWHNWVFTKNATTGYMYIYLNGVVWHSGSGKTSTIPAMIAPVGLARYNRTPFYYMNGKIANTLIYNSSLTAAEVLQNYNALKNRFI